VHFSLPGIALIAAFSVIVPAAGNRESRILRAAGRRLRTPAQSRKDQNIRRFCCLNSSEAASGV
jgi:hypothetical protein